MHESLLQNISKHVKLSPEEITLFNTFWTTKTLEKGDYLLQNGKVCKTDNYVISGSLKAFYINPEKGTEEILYFAIDDWWATDILSFQKQEPSMYTIQALEKTELLQIQHLAFQNMLVEIPTLERYFRIILEGYTASLQRRIVISNTYDAAHRYADFLENYPQLAKRVPQYLIASYLGVTPEFISRIRKNKPKLN